MKVMMDGIEITANSQRGVEFVLGMQRLRLERENKEAQFSMFCDSNQINAWHIHDGWVMNKQGSGDVLGEKDLRLVWIESHTSSHSKRMPTEGENVLLLKDVCPKGQNKIIGYKYTVTNLSWRHHLELKLIGIVVINITSNGYSLEKSRIKTFLNIIRQ